MSSFRINRNMNLPYISLDRIEELKRQHNVCECNLKKLYQTNQCQASYIPDYNDRYFTELGESRSYCECLISDISHNNGNRCVNLREMRKDYCHADFKQKIRSKLLNNNELGGYQQKCLNNSSRIGVDLSESLPSLFFHNNCNLCECLNSSLKNTRQMSESVECTKNCENLDTHHKNGFFDESNGYDGNNSDIENNTDNEYTGVACRNSHKTNQKRKVFPGEITDSEDDMEIAINRNNRKIVLLAINWISLSGEHNKKIRKFIQESMESCELINVPHFVILFQYDDHKSVRGIYTYSKEDKKWYCVIEITSKCPRIIEKEMIHTLYKFDTCQKIFKPIKRLRKITDIVDGLSLKNEYLNN
ncbi:hypothetical protein FG379_000121 [Cryptosporidium bovis]|uniref:uncharacterized protein n=1 Tax=Cryptosporidium bovis TaxID=310047 RepID=UPI00351A27CA|nr:hypothetical protein FG379_000121 [Cryptosporidium bovis]